MLYAPSPPTSRQPPVQALTPSKPRGLGADANEKEAHSTHYSPSQAQGSMRPGRRQNGAEGPNLPQRPRKRARKRKRRTQTRTSQPTQRRSSSESSKGWLQSQNACFIPPNHHPFTTPPLAELNPKPGPQAQVRMQVGSACADGCIAVHTVQSYASGCTVRCSRSRCDVSRPALG
jgi:hypothetical protein